MGFRVTRKEAEELIARVRAAEVPFNRLRHYKARSASRGFSAHDEWAILGVHELESAPEWKEEFLCFRVRLLGKCMAGRRTRMVLDLRADGPCVLVSMMVVRDRPKRRRML
jgi:hypothetical protein